MNREVSQRLEELSHTVIGAAIKVHSALGAGLLESAYEHCLLYELRKQGIHAMAQVSLPIYYDGQEIEAGYRIDLLVENDLIIELKAVESLLPIHTAQVLSYLKMADKKLGLLINFNVTSLKRGIKRVINAL
ncbi:MAG: GxxExxY protein [Zetaproteobacteria bacterium CG2_30_46_52]|nr:MAG: GxxExxY protein [Zetaproteobacteria bacterium CG2_30_46_52]